MVVWISSAFDVPNAYRLVQGLLNYLSVKLVAFFQTVEFATEEALAQVGVKVKLRLEDVPTYLRRVYTDYDFDLTSTWFISLTDPAMGVQRIYWSKNIRPGVSFSNASGYTNPKADQLWEKAAAEVDDTKRAGLYKQVQKIVVDEIPVIWLQEIPDVVAGNTKVHNLFTSPQGLRAGLYDTWIEK